MATESISEFFSSTEGEDSTWPFHFDPQRTYEENRLIAGVKLANRRIFEASAENLDVQGMGTTVVGLVFSATRDKVYIGHVGDSRCYRLRDDEFDLLTRDHSLVNDYRQAMPHLTEEQMAELPRNVITRALGMQESVVVDIQSDRPHQGDIYLLCSDGLSEAVTDDEILESLAPHQDDLDHATEELIALANVNGGDDNITVVLVAVDEVAEVTGDPEDSPVPPDPDSAPTVEIKSVDDD